MTKGSSDRPLPELMRSRVFLYRLSSSAAASYMSFPGKPGSSGVKTTLLRQPIWLIAIWLIAAFREYSDLPDPLQTTQLLDFSSSYSGSSLFFFMSRMLSRILFTYPTLLTLFLFLLTLYSEMV